MKVKCAKCGASLTFGQLPKIKATLVLVIETSVKQDNIHLYRDVELPFIPSSRDVIKVGNILHHVEYSSYTHDDEWIRVLSRERVTGRRSFFKKTNDAAVEKLVQEYLDAGWTR